MLIGLVPGNLSKLEEEMVNASKLSSFVDKLLQPIAIQQKSYLKDSTDLINFIENMKVPADAILVSMDVTRAYETFYVNKPPISPPLLEQSLRLILQENSFQFAGKKLPPNTWHSHGHKDGSSIC